MKCQILFSEEKISKCLLKFLPSILGFNYWDLNHPSVREELTKIDHQDSCCVGHLRFLIGKIRETICMKHLTFFSGKI